MADEETFTNLGLRGQSHIVTHAVIPTSSARGVKEVGLLVSISEVLILVESRTVPLVVNIVNSAIDIRGSRESRKVDKVCANRGTD